MHKLMLSMLGVPKINLISAPSESPTDHSKIVSTLGLKKKKNRQNEGGYENAVN